MQLVFDTHGNAKQKEVCVLWLDDEVTDICFGGAKACGKSYLGCSLIFGDAFIYPGTHYFIARKRLKDLVRYTIPTIHEVFGNWGIDPGYYKFNGSYNYFELYNGSRVYLIDAAYQPQDPRYERFGSMQMTRGMIEEGGEFSRDAKNNLQASLGRWKNDMYGLKPKLLTTCNPSNNYLFTDYYEPFRKHALPSWRRFVQALPEDNKMLPAGYVENLLRNLTRTQIERLVYGNWEYDDDPSWLVDADAVMDMFVDMDMPYGELRNWHGEYPAAGQWISTDLADRGRDRWIVGHWRGLTVKFPVVEKYARGKQIETTLRDLSARHNVPRSHIVADSDGLGTFLESYMNGIYEFKGGARPYSALYENLKAECGYKLAEMINKRELKVICPEEYRDAIREELGVLKTKNLNTDTARLRLIDKDTMKTLLGRSPDFLDVLLMRMVFLVKPAAKGIRKIEY